MSEPKVVSEKSNMSINLEEKTIKGIKNLNLDDKITISLNAKVTSISRDNWNKEKLISVRAEVLSGKILDTEIKKEIEEAENIKDLEKAGKKISDSE